MNDPTDLANLMVRTADVICACLADTPNGTPGFCGVYNNVPPDDLDCGDCGSNGGLFVWVEQIFPSQSFPQPWQGQVGPQQLAVQAAAQIAVRLIRPCWPVIQNVANAPKWPSREETEEAAVNLATDYSVMFCCLLSDLSSSNSTILGGQCGRARMGVLTPDRNRGGCAGASVKFSVDLAACCLPVPAS